MKYKILSIFITILMIINPVFAKVDRYSEEYLKSKKHFAIINPIAESIIQKSIKKAILKETEGNYKVKFTAYNASSLKKGIFKYLEIIGKDVIVNDLKIPYFKLETETDYNWIDYTQDPAVFKSDITFNTETHITEQSINQSLQTEKYKNKLEKVNKYAYPLFIINDVRIKIRHDKVHIIMEYNFPIVPAKKNRTFMVSSNFKVDNGKIKASNIGIDNAYGNLPVDKVTNLINLLDPLSFTIDLFDTKKCKGRVESLQIEDDILKVNGKIFIKGDEK